MTALIAAEGLSVDLGGRRVLDRVDLALAPGEIVVVVGPNGSGKSTLLRALVGSVAPAAGRVVRRKGLGLGYVPQGLELDASLPMTVGRFLDLPRRHAPGDKAHALARTGVEGLGDRPLSRLSGGQFQRVMLARALLGRPDLLLLDEPTQGLDPQGVAAFYALIADLRAETGCAVALVSHDLHVVMRAADRVVCLNGHVCCHGTPEAVTATPAYRELVGHGLDDSLALYAHRHDHSHDHGAA